ncbi:MAG: glycosyltransferase family protein [Ilumatobacteraceae bacterium]
MEYGCVVSYHTNPYTCGVARFNQALARTLGVDLISVTDFINHSEGLPFLSLKFEEIPDQVAQELLQHVLQTNLKFDLFLHGVHESEPRLKLVARARKVFVGSVDHADVIRPTRSDVVALFAPGAPFTGDKKSFGLTLLTFGMAHKIRADGYRKLGQIMATDHRSVQLEISTALHEGTSFNDDFFSVNAEIAEVFTGSVIFLGFLADGEVSRRLRVADALIAFFPGGVRENNTTVLSAMAHGCAVITNMDHYSPAWMKHGESIFDIDRLTTFPSADELAKVRSGAIEAVEPYTFERFAELLTNRDA